MDFSPNDLDRSGTMAFGKAVSQQTGDCKGQLRIIAQLEKVLSFWSICSAY